jgi:predicted PurR-regulated permease PerM
VERSRLVNLLLVLLVLIAALFLGRMLWELLSGYADILVLFLLGWLVAFILKPLISALSENLFLYCHSLGDRVIRPQSATSAEFRLSRSAAVIIVYVLLVLIIVFAFAYFVPRAAGQLSDLATHLPELYAQAPQAGEILQTEIGRLGLKINIEQAVQAGLRSLENYATTLIQNTLGILSGVLGFLANVFIVLILSFYFAIDESRLRNGLLHILPEQYHDEAHYFARSVDRTFGGFMRGQLIQALFQGIVTAIVMTVLGLDFVLVASLFAGLFMLIPLVGPFLTLVPPIMVALIEAPSSALWVFLALLIFQFVLVNVFMPRVISEAVGLHPLLVFFAILVSIKLAGFWGAFFGIPVAGVLWAMLSYFYETWHKSEAIAGKITETSKAK